MGLLYGTPSLILFQPTNCCEIGACRNADESPVQDATSRVHCLDTLVTLNTCGLCDLNLLAVLEQLSLQALNAIIQII